MEFEFVMIKPDAVVRGLVGNIIERIENCGLKIIAMKMIHVSKELAEEHYAIHKERPFFSGLIKYITSGPCVPMIVEGKNAVQKMRHIAGATNPIEATPGTIRGDLAMDIGRNCIHAADSPENAQNELKIYFSPEEFLKYSRVDIEWIYE